MLQDSNSSHENSQELLTHFGSCHCGKVTFSVKAPAVIEVVQCSCSICRMKGNDHFIVPAKNFQLLSGDEHLRTYTFNTHTAKHIFCTNCGVQSFYRPRSNPDGYGVNIHCVRAGTVQRIVWQQFDGRQWEDEMQKDQLGLVNRSKIKD